MLILVPACGQGADGPSGQLRQIPAMPIPVNQQRSANTRWLNNPVLGSRLLDGMEDPATWDLRGPGEVVFTAERAHESKHSMRLVCPTKGTKPAPNGRPWAEANLVRRFDRENFTAFNRISFWVYPTLPGFENGSVVVKLLNDGKMAMPTHGPLHYAIVKPGKWNHIVWEIAHLERDKVTSIELTYRQQGNEPGASETAMFDFDRLELQKVEADHFEGWRVAPGRIAYSHTGYETKGPKIALATGLDARTFQIHSSTIHSRAVEKPIRTVRTPIGEFQVLDFFDWSTPDRITITAGNLKTQPIPIADNIWRDTIIKTISFFYAERCGQKIEGIHDVCHADWQAVHNGKSIIVNGGWHDAGDLSQGLINTGEAVHAMFTLADRLKASDALLANRLIEEAKWGLAWVHKTRFGDGYRVTWGTMDYWTDGKIGTTNDDTFAQVGNGVADNAVGASASAIAARVLKISDPRPAEEALNIARADWQFAMDRLDLGRANVEAVGAAALASIELYKTTREQKYVDKAVELAKFLVNSQQKAYPKWDIPLVGFFYTSPRKDRILNYAHRGHDQAPVVPLVELCGLLPEHPDWMEWYSTVALHSEYQKAAAEYQAPYHTLPAGVYALSTRPDQVRNGLKLSETHYLRRFPVWDSFRGHYGILLSQSKSLAAAARLRNRADLADLVHEQLQWVVGRNPFGQSTMYGEGYDYAPQYTAMSGDMTGSLPVGIQSALDRDLPYWPATNCWNYKEVWVHPSSRWLYTLADLAAAPADEAAVVFDLNQRMESDGRITVALTARGKGSHRFTLKAANAEFSRTEQVLSLSDSAPAKITWTGRILSADQPWVAVVMPDNNPAGRKDVVVIRR